MASPFLNQSQLDTAVSYFGAGNALRAAANINLMRQLRAAMPFAPMLLDENTTLGGRIQIVQSLDNESLAYTAALLGVDPRTFPATITLRPVSLINDVIRILSTFPATKTSENLPLPIEVEALTTLHLSETFPLVRMRTIFDGAMSGRVPFASTLAALEKFNATDVELPGWVAKARAGQQARLPLGWTVQVISLYGDLRDADSLMDVYMADLSDPRQMITICRALLTAYDIQSVSGTQTPQHHLVQRVHDYAVVRSQGNALTLAVLCSHQPGEYVKPWLPPMLTQLLMTTAALSESLGMRFAEIDMDTSVKVVSLATPTHVQIGNLVTSAPAPLSIRLLLPALAHSAYVRHPAASEFATYQWVNRLSQNQARWNGSAAVTGMDASLLSARASLMIDALDQAGVSQPSAALKTDSFEFSVSDYIYKAAFSTTTVPAVRAQKRTTGLDYYDDDDDPMSGGDSKRSMTTASIANL